MGNFQKIPENKGELSDLVWKIYDEQKEKTKASIYIELYNNDNPLNPISSDRVYIELIKIFEQLERYIKYPEDMSLEKLKQIQEKLSKREGYSELYKSDI